VAATTIAGVLPVLPPASIGPRKPMTPQSTPMPPPTHEYWSETATRHPQWPTKVPRNVVPIGANLDQANQCPPLRATHHRQVIVREPIQSHQAKAVLGVSSRSTLRLGHRQLRLWIPGTARTDRNNIQLNSPTRNFIRCF
jgi:hypothetical protein